MWFSQILYSLHWKGSLPRRQVLDGIEESWQRQHGLPVTPYEEVLDLKREKIIMREREKDYVLVRAISILMSSGTTSKIRVKIRIPRRHYFENIIWYHLPFFVLELMGAPLSRSISTTCSWPDRAAQWRGVRPSRVLLSMLPPRSKRRATMLLLPHLAATWRGVMLC